MWDLQADWDGSVYTVCMLKDFAYMILCKAKNQMVLTFKKEKQISSIVRISLPNGSAKLQHMHRNSLRHIRWKIWEGQGHHSQHSDCISIWNGIPYIIGLPHE